MANLDSEFVPVNEPLLDGNEAKYLLECIDSGWISSEGPFVQEFERQFAARMGRKYGIAVCNGTAAIDAAVEALNIGPGDEVILPSFTIISCVLQIIRSGATPVLVDSDPMNWNLDPDQIESRITHRTKAIMVVHIYGLPVDMKPVMELARAHGLKVIEDAAEAIGQSYLGKPCGSFGDVSTVSFYPNKHVTTGEGGMILTDDEELAESCRQLRNLCFTGGRRFVHERLGWNLRMTNLQAALGIAQLERLDYFMEKKISIGKRYNQLLKDIPYIILPLDRTCYADNCFWVYGLVLTDGIGFDAKEAIARFAERGIGCRPFFYPLHRQPVLKRLGLFQDVKLPVSENLGERGLYLPSGVALTDRQIDRVTDVCHDILVK